MMLVLQFASPLSGQPCMRHLRLMFFGLFPACLLPVDVTPCYCLYEPSAQLLSVIETVSGGQT